MFSTICSDHESTWEGPLQVYLSEGISPVFPRQRCVLSSAASYTHGPCLKAPRGLSVDPDSLCVCTVVCDCGPACVSTCMCCWRCWERPCPQMQDSGVGGGGRGVSVQAVSRLEGDRQDTDCFAGKGWSLQSRHVPHAHG